MQNIVFIVGDKLKNFSCNQNVMTFSEFMRMLDMVKINNIQTNYILAQGLSYHQVSCLQKAVIALKSNNIVLHSTPYIKEDEQFVHKLRQENSMISQPVRINNRLYISQLMLDDECDEMRDHVTGQHIQGVVITEAARQMMLSVSERHLLPKPQQFNSYFVLEFVNSNFAQFVFPLELEIICKVQSADVNNHGKLKSDLIIEFIQNDRLVASINIGFSTYAKDWLLNKENKLAEAAITHALMNTSSLKKAVNSGFIGI